MQNNNKFFNDMARMAGGAASGLMDIKREIEAIVETQIEKLLQKMNLVTKEEFDTVQAMLKKSRIEQEELKKRLEALESHINSLK